ncbi:MAG: hypothetical protein Q9210_001683, partial [Variospora velana]
RARYTRPDPNYAQPSRRYLDLLRTGAEEHGIPREYRDYLDGLRPYTITTQGQRMGRFVFSMTWLPVFRAVFMLNRLYGDEQGRSPPWLVRLLGSVFAGVWTSYDGWMKGVFGDGERTIEEGRQRRRLVKKRREDGETCNDIFNHRQIAWFSRRGGIIFRRGAEAVDDASRVGDLAGHCAEIISGYGGKGRVRLRCLAGGDVGAPADGAMGDGGGSQAGGALRGEGGNVGGAVEKIFLPSVREDIG